MEIAFEAEQITLDEVTPKAEKLAREGWRLAALTCVPLAAEAGSAWEVLYHFVQGGQLLHLRLPVAHDQQVPSLSTPMPGVALSENEIQDLFGVTFKGLNPDYRGRLLLTEDAPLHPGNLASAGLTEQRLTLEPLEAEPHEVSKLQPGQTVIPFGPQHPVLPEPIQLRLVLQEEKVVGVEPVLGYVHRGLEKMAESRDYPQNVFIVERVCGICSFMHALAYCMGIEELMGVTVPDRARYLRVVWAELHRIHSHLLWAGLYADAFGFESLFMQAWRAREIVLDLLEKTAGNRIIISTAMVGGCKRDIDAGLAAEVKQGLDRLAKEIEQLVRPLTEENTVRQRTAGKGVVTAEDARRWGVVGPVARAAGLAEDVRSTGYAAYGDLDFQPVTEEGGDALARAKVRLRECFQSIDLVRAALDKMPEGEIAVPVKGNPDGEVVTRVEQPRGEVLYYLRANGDKKLTRLRVRTPTFANLPAAFGLIPGHELADVPVLIVSFDPCVSCTER